MVNRNFNGLIAGDLGHLIGPKSLLKAYVFKDSLGGVNDFFVSGEKL